MNRSNFLSGLLGGLVAVVIGAWSSSPPERSTPATSRRSSRQAPARADAPRCVEQRRRQVGGRHLQAGRAGRRVHPVAGRPADLQPVRLPAAAEGRGHRLGLRARTSRASSPRTRTWSTARARSGRLRQRQPRAGHDHGQGPLDRPRRDQGRPVEGGPGSRRSRWATPARPRSATPWSRSATRSATTTPSRRASSRRSSARSRPPTTSPSTRDPDRRGDQPRQLRRPAARQPGPGDRHQLPDRHERRQQGLGGHRLRDPGQPREDELSRSSRRAAR